MKNIIYLLLLLTGLVTNKITAQTAKNNFEKETEAIRKVISNETETYYKQDFEGWKKNYVNGSHFRLMGYWDGYPEKVRYYNGFDTLKNAKESQFRENRTYWKGSYEKRYNENFRIYNDIAWYSFEQDSYDGKTNEFLGKSVELRIMEKENGDWKIAFLGFHYLPLERNDQNASVERVIIRSDSLLNDLIKNGNAAAASDYYTENFILTTSSGVVKNKGDMLKEIGNAGLKFEVNEISNASVSVTDKTAILTGHLHQKGIYNGKPFDYRFRVTDTWVYLNGKWNLMGGQAALISK